MAITEASLPLTTKRLAFSEATADDALFFLELLNEHAYIENISDKGVRNPKQAVDYINRIVRKSYAKHGFGMYVVRLQSNGDALGICGLVKRDDLEEVDLGFAFLERYWTQGFAAEAARAVLTMAFTMLNLNSIAAIVTPKNLPSLRLLKKLGFARTKAYKIPGQSELLDCLALSRADYLSS